MAYTEQQAVDEVAKHFSGKTARAIVGKIGVKGVFEGAGPAYSDTGKAVAHVESFGHTRAEAEKIVKKVGAHLVLAHAQCGFDPKKSFWDGQAKKSDAAASSGPSDKQ